MIPLCFPLLAMSPIYNVHDESVKTDMEFKNIYDNAIDTIPAKESISFLSVSSMSVGVSISSAQYNFIDSTTTTFFHVAVSTRGYTVFHSAPASLSSCGTSSIVYADNTHGTVTVAGVVTACTVNFGSPYVNTPTCVVTDNNTGISADVASISNSAVTFGFSISLGGGQFYYACFANE